MLVAMVSQRHLLVSNPKREKLFKWHQWVHYGIHAYNTSWPEESEVRKLQSGKSEKNQCKDYIQTTCISSDNGEYMCKV